ncbi:hypothetical protein DFJ73DRAFT_871379, partial [Zopfochytrium polystomum]
TARRSIGSSLIEVRSGSRGVDKAQVLNDEKSDGSQMGETEMMWQVTTKVAWILGCGGGTRVCSDWIETTAGNTNVIGQQQWQVDWGLAVEFLKTAIAASSEGDNFAIAAFGCDCDSRGRLWSAAIWWRSGSDWQGDLRRQLQSGGNLATAGRLQQRWWWLPDQSQLGMGRDAQVVDNR